MVRSCVASLSEKHIPAHVGDRLMIRKSMPDKGEPLVVKLYSSDLRFRREVDNGKKLWDSVPPGLKQFLGVPFYGATVATEEVKGFFGYNDKKQQVQKNRDTLKLQAGSSVAFTVDQCEKALAQGTKENMYMIVSPRYDMDLRTVLSKKSKADKVEALCAVFGVLAKLNDKLVHSDPFVDNVLFEKDEPRLIDFEYLREGERLYARPERPQRFGPAELVVPEVVAYMAAFETLSRVPNEVVPEERVLPVYHPKTKARDLVPRIDGYAYAQPEGKTRVEWMRDGATVELALLFPVDEVKAVFATAIPALAARFATDPASKESVYADAAAMALMRARYDPFKLAMSIHLMSLESGIGLEARDAVFVTRLIKGLTHPDVAQRLSAAEAHAWLTAYAKHRPVAVKKAPSFAAASVQPLPRVGGAVTPEHVFAYSAPEASGEPADKLAALAGIKGGKAAPAAPAAPADEAEKPAAAPAKEKKKPASAKEKKPVAPAKEKKAAPAKEKAKKKEPAAPAEEAAVPTPVAPEAPPVPEAPVPTAAPSALPSAPPTVVPTVVPQGVVSPAIVPA